MLYDVVWCCMMLYDVVWCCMMLYDFVWCSTQNGRRPHPNWNLTQNGRRPYPKCLFQRIRVLHIFALRDFCVCKSYFKNVVYSVASLFPRRDCDYHQFESGSRESLQTAWSYVDHGVTFSSNKWLPGNDFLPAKPAFLPWPLQLFKFSHQVFWQVLVVKKNQVISLIIQGLISAELHCFFQAFLFYINPEWFLTRNCGGGFFFWYRYTVVSVGITVKFSSINK